MDGRPAPPRLTRPSTQPTPALTLSNSDGVGGTNHTAKAHTMNTNQPQTPAAPTDPAALPAIVFDHAGHAHPIRTARDPSGHMQWVARDVCEALGITKQSRALERVNPADKGRTKLSTPGGPQDFVTVNRSGLFALVFQSRKPPAKAFQHWVTSIVLPAIEQDGAYIRGEEAAHNATTAGELQAHQQATRVVAAQAIEAKETRGLIALEERDARSSGFALMRGRSHRTSYRGEA